MLSLISRSHKSTSQKALLALLPSSSSPSPASRALARPVSSAPSGAATLGRFNPSSGDQKTRGSGSRYPSPSPSSSSSSPSSSSRDGRGYSIPSASAPRSSPRPDSSSSSSSFSSAGQSRNEPDSRSSGSLESPAAAAASRLRFASPTLEEPDAEDAAEVEDTTELLLTGSAQFLHAKQLAPSLENALQQFKLRYGLLIQSRHALDALKALGVNGLFLLDDPRIATVVTGDTDVGGRVDFMSRPLSSGYAVIDPDLELEQLARVAQHHYPQRGLALQHKKKLISYVRGELDGDVFFGTGPAFLDYATKLLFLASRKSTQELIEAASQYGKVADSRAQLLPAPSTFAPNSLEFLSKSIDDALNFTAQTDRFKAYAGEKASHIFSEISRASGILDKDRFDAVPLTREEKLARIAFLVDLVRWADRKVRDIDLALSTTPQVAEPFNPNLVHVTPRTPSSTTVRTGKSSRFQENAQLAAESKNLTRDAAIAKLSAANLSDADREVLKSYYDRGNSDPSWRSPFIGWHHLNKGALGAAEALSFESVHADPVRADARVRDLRETLDSLDKAAARGFAQEQESSFAENLKDLAHASASGSTKQQGLTESAGEAPGTLAPAKPQFLDFAEKYEVIDRQRFLRRQARKSQYALTQAPREPTVQYLRSVIHGILGIPKGGLSRAVSQLSVPEFSRGSVVPPKFVEILQKSPLAQSIKVEGGIAYGRVLRFLSSNNVAELDIGSKFSIFMPVPAEAVLEVGSLVPVLVLSTETVHHFVGSNKGTSFLQGVGVHIGSLLRHEMQVANRVYALRSAAASAKQK